MDVAGTVYTIRPSCLRALDGDQSRGFGASAVLQVGIGWAPEVFYLSLTDLGGRGGLFNFDFDHFREIGGPACSPLPRDVNLVPPKL